MEEKLNITKKEFLTADKYVFTTNKTIKNGIIGFNFYLLKRGKFKRVVGGELCKRTKTGIFNYIQYYHSDGWGTDRKAEILFSIAKELGVEYSKVNKNKIIFL